MNDERSVREMVRRVVLRTVQAASDVRPMNDSRLVTEKDIEDVTPGCDLRVADEAIVTPLARQAALERGVTLVRGEGPAETYSGDGDRGIALAADHGGFEMKEALASHLREREIGRASCRERV